MTRKLYVLLGDVVASRKIDATDPFQKKIERALARLNLAYAKAIYAPFKVLKGRDEMGAVLTSISGLYSMLIEFYSFTRPAVTRFALVKGEVDTGLRSKDTAKMDGLAFHRAAKMIDEMKKNKVLFQMAGGDEFLDPIFTASINASLTLRQNWTSHQWRIVLEYEKHETQAAAAKRLGITQQAVSEVLLSAQWERIKNIESALNQSLQRYDLRIK